MASEETAFLRGDVGVDGRATEEERDEAEVSKGKALEALARNRTWLGRELLTWLLYKTNSGDPITAVDGEDIHVIFVGPVVLQGISGDATEVRAKGHQSAYADVVREALARGLLVHQARLRIMVEDKAWEVTLDAEHLSYKSASLPKLLTEETDDRLMERLELLDRMTKALDALWEAFVAVRAEPEWISREVPELRAWLDEVRDEG